MTSRTWGRSSTLLSVVFPATTATSPLATSTPFLNTTKLYLRLVPSDLKDAYDRYFPVLKV